MRQLRACRLAGLCGALGLAILLAACGKKSSDTTTTASGSLTALSDSGTPRSLDGTWTACNSSVQTREILTVSGASATDITYTSTVGPTCAGGTAGTLASLTLTAIGPFTMTGSTGPSGPSTATGWINGVTGAVLTAPAKASGVGNLANNVVATQFMLTGAFAGTHSFFFDDSAGAPFRLYQSIQGGAYCPLVSGSEVCMAGDVYSQ